MKCPTCSKVYVEIFKPFCSKRCSDIDLNRWANESYVVPGEPIDAFDDELFDPHTLE
jgi:uncharacterized protein|tara:strand:- start:6873 stop:7043 length:171 start_codon:yes stop_codon:yes gene_type:complete